MSTLFFNDAAIEREAVESWPQSPNREAHKAGRYAYRDKDIQQALKAPSPESSVNLSSYRKILKAHGPYMHNGVELYERDPLLAIMKATLGKNYVTDDYFKPEVWFNAKTGVTTHQRVAQKVKNPELYKDDGITITQKGFETSGEGISIFDMEQGDLGDCGFVSTIGALTLHPEGHNLLFSSIYPCVYNPIGIYSVRMIIEGRIYYILVDDSMPEPKHYYSYMHQKREFWYFIIEKAHAKLVSGYGNLGGGHETYFGMEATANVHINQDNKDEVWNNNFTSDFMDNHLVTYQGTRNHKYLIGRHAYVVLDAQAWNDTKLVRLHNPWNEVDYKGPYAPGSSDWNNIPKGVQYSVFQSGRFFDLTFWMPYDDYIADIPVISKLYLADNFPSVLKSIAKYGKSQG